MSTVSSDIVSGRCAGKGSVAEAGTVELVAETPLVVGWTVGFQADGREVVVVIAKGTFAIDGDDSVPTLSATQEELVGPDEFTGEPGLSATRVESDYAHQKPFCDVLVNGCAYSPTGDPVEKVVVGLYTGSVQKSFEVVGDRFWDDALSGLTHTPPVPFTSMPLFYDRAYGGMDTVQQEDGLQTRAYAENPVGAGYYPLSRGKALTGKPLANTQQIGSPVDRLAGDYRPMALGSVSRNARSRVRYAGTYDQNWLNTQFPFFPVDFDSRYFQSASIDQQMPYPRGGEQVVLENLSASGRMSFRLPAMQVPVLFLPYRGREMELEARMDTVVIEPDANRVLLTWRAFLPLRRNCFEIKTVVVGQTALAHRRSQKPHFPNLRSFVNSRRGIED
jgi:hypothetical protein